MAATLCDLSDSGELNRWRIENVDAEGLDVADGGTNIILRRELALFLPVSLHQDDANVCGRIQIYPFINEVR
jgi:hypothetical protein